MVIIFQVYWSITSGALTFWSILQENGSSEEAEELDERAVLFYSSGKKQRKNISDDW